MLPISDTFNDYLQKDGQIAVSIALFNRFSDIGDKSYIEICGGFIEGVYQWATHNITTVEWCFDEKNTYLIVDFENGTSKQVYISNNILSITPSNWLHAKNLFNKYLKVDYKFNS